MSIKLVCNRRPAEFQQTPEVDFTLDECLDEGIPEGARPAARVGEARHRGGRSIAGLRDAGRVQDEAATVP